MVKTERGGIAEWRHHVIDVGYSEIIDDGLASACVTSM
jgi:hypothetical protein